MMEQKLKDLLRLKKCTLLGVGPMSKNCVDAAVNLANLYSVPIMLIASRRQIDSERFGGGYVNNWTTSEFSNYVSSIDKGGYAILSRDHGGPWQNNIEITSNMSLSAAMESAKESYRFDIDAGFKILHIDPSIDIHGSPSINDILSRIYELYEFCWRYAKKIGSDIIFEIGTEEQSGGTNTQEQLDYTLHAIKKFCRNNKLPAPTFVVIQTGTKVMETRNIGSFDSPFRVIDEIPAEIQVPKMIEICNHHDILMKEHNADYLSDEALQWHPRLGIHAANVAPEFGVSETRAYLELLENHGLKKIADEFLEIAYNSKKWSKWMLPNGFATDRDKSIIAGHYIFADEEFLENKENASKELKIKGVIVDEYLKNSVSKSIYRYMKNFRLVGQS